MSRDRFALLVLLPHPPRGHTSNISPLSNLRSHVFNDGNVELSRGKLKRICRGSSQPVPRLIGLSCTMRPPGRSGCTRFSEYRRTYRIPVVSCTSLCAVARRTRNYRRLPLLLRIQVSTRFNGGTPQSVAIDSAASDVPIAILRSTYLYPTLATVDMKRVLPGL